MVHDLFNILNEYNIDILNLNQNTINKIDNLTSIYNEDKEDKNKIYSSSLLSFLLIEHLTTKRVDTIYDVNDQALFKKINSAVEALELISGQKPIKTIAKKAIAGFKLREGLPVGVKVTLRKKY